MRSGFCGTFICTFAPKISWYQASKAHIRWPRGRQTQREKRKDIARYPVSMREKVDSEIEQYVTQMEPLRVTETEGMKARQREWDTERRLALTVSRCRAMEHLCWAELSQRSRGFSEKESVRNTKTFHCDLSLCYSPVWLHCLLYMSL